MPIQGILVGRDAHAYWSLSDPLDPNYNPWPGTQAGAQAWIDNANTFVAENIMDLTDNVDSEMADNTTRKEAKVGWTSEIAVLRTGQVQFDIRWEPGDPFTDEVIARWDDGEGISMVFLDQDGRTTNTATNTAQGLGAVWSISLTKTETLRDIQKASLTLTVAGNPLWVTGLGGAP